MNGFSKGFLDVFETTSKIFNSEFMQYLMYLLGVGSGIALIIIIFLLVIIGVGLSIFYFAFNDRKFRIFGKG